MNGSLLPCLDRLPPARVTGAWALAFAACVGQATVMATEAGGDALAARSAAAKVLPAPRHEWRDAGGRVNRSNLPRNAFTADGRLHPAWDPNHPASQQAALKQLLAEREQQLRAQREARTPTEARAAGSTDSRTDTPRAVPRQRMDLGELIDLGKNAGRPVAP